MSVGKYSPTVTASYRANKDWWVGNENDSTYDNQGYDRYGYNRNDTDRAGYQELDYLNWDEDSQSHSLYEMIVLEWQNKIIDTESFWNTNLRVNPESSE